MLTAKTYHVSHRNITLGARPKLFENVASLYLNEKISDVIFLVGDERIPAQRAILAANSERFQIYLEATPEKKEYEIPFASPEAFKCFLKYIYFGKVNCASLDIYKFTEVFFLACRFFFKDLAAQVEAKIQELLNPCYVVYCINAAYKENFYALVNLCNTYIDKNVDLFLESEAFEDLSEIALTEILQRPSFLGAAQIEIFNSVAKWCERVKRDVTISRFVRMDWLTLPEIVYTVFPKDLVDYDDLLDLISEIVLSPLEFTARRKIPDKNFATVENGATAMVVSQEARDNLFDTGSKANTSVEINGENGIIICLNKPYVINHIRMKLCDHDEWTYSYYIEASVDGAKWHKIVDYSQYACRSVQNLYFAEEVVQYIKLVGTKNSSGDDFRVVFFETFYKIEIPATENGVIYPTIEKTINLRTIDNEYADEHVFVSNDGGHDYDSFLIQLSQPYRLTSIHLELDDGLYTFNIEASEDNVFFERLFDSTQEEHFAQRDIQFSERNIASFRINGFCNMRVGSLTLSVHVP